MYGVRRSVALFMTPLYRKYTTLGYRDVMDPTSPVDTTFRDWRSYAACADAPDPDVFHLPSDSKLTKWARETFCSACPVAAKCLDLGNETGSSGLFAGGTSVERRGLRRARADAKRSANAAELTGIRDRQICELTLRGRSAGDISEILRTNERTVGRVLERHGVEAYTC